MAGLSVEVIEGPDAGRRIELTGSLELGRQDGLGLVLRDPLVSRRHAMLRQVQGGVTVEDLGSRNGTFVGGNQIHGPTLATPGDQIQLGVSVLQLRSAEQVAERPSAVRAVPPGLAAPERSPDYLPADVAATGPTPPPPVGPVGAGPVRGPREVPIPQLDPLLDVHVKRRAVLAPLAVFVVAALAVMIWLATR